MRPANHSTSFCFLLSVLWLVGGWAIGVVPSARAEPDIRTAEPVFQVSDSLLLDQYPDARAAYSLRKLRSDYNGPAIRLRRSSDGAEQDFGFTTDGLVDTSAIANFVGDSDGYVTTWYSQVQGVPDLVQSDTTRQPFIAKSGSVTTDGGDRVAIKFDSDRNTYLALSSRLSNPVPVEESMVYAVGEKLQSSSTQGIVALAQPEDDGRGNFIFRTWKEGGFNADDGISSQSWIVITNNPGFWATNHDGGNQGFYGNNELYKIDAIDGSLSTNGLTVGMETLFENDGFEGFISEVAVLPGQPTESDVLDVYDNVNTSWEVGPLGYNREALMPQRSQWLITLYDWLETLSTEDVTLPDGTLTYDNSYNTEDELADIWLKTRALSASSVTRREPDWYVLDNGDGKGIEGTGVVRANHEPRGNGDYGGNPPRSWQNEPAYWYKLDLPLSGGGQGNPWHQDPAMGRRAMAVSIVDLMMHQGIQGGSQDWYDIKGKAFLGMAEAYRWAGEVLPPDVQDAYEKGMEEIVDDLTARGPRAVNTNMDMFAVHGAADLYMATDDAVLQQKCVEMVKAALFGYKDGDLETNHKVFAIGGRDGGVFSSAGYIMEGGQPDVFYGGESNTQIAGALAAVMDRSNGSLPSDWTFLQEVVRRLQEWRSYQMFYDPAAKSPAIGGGKSGTFITAGAGFSGRTGAGVPNGQAGASFWSDYVIGDRYADHAFKGGAPSVSSMESGISNALASMNEEMDSAYTEGQPKEWNGWSPWTKHTVYLPPEGWYSNFKNLKQNNDPKFLEPPPARSGNTFNKALGGPPLGKSYWSYKQEDANGEEWGFFVEAQARQGSYGGWYGGKIETFWTESTGVILLNRHGKGGCDRSGVDDYSGNEDSACWFNLDEKAGHHVWGRDENGNGFTTLRLVGRNLSRTSTFNTDGSPPTVTVTNIFNDPSHPEVTSRDGEQTGSEIEGSFEVENKFEAQSNGLKVTHTLSSDESDQVNELWASLPVYLRQYNPHDTGDQIQSSLDDTKIEYWDGSQWVELPFDTDSDGVPEIITTGALRLTRDYEGFAGNGGPAHAYVHFSSDHDVRRSKHKYYDPYQTSTGVRTVHIDLHGNPGTTKMLPASKSVSYTIQTTDPTSEGGTSTSQTIPLQSGWNVVSTSVSPGAPAMDSVFADLQSEILVVKNEAGERYRPDEDVNEIGQWNSEEAYRVYAKSDVTLTIEGDALGSPSISLEKGWNLVPYFPDSSLSVDEALSSIAEDLDLVKDEAGRVYLPEMDPDVLEQMEPGEGYKIYVRQSTTLNYPEDGN